jgi:hypothetical protein
MSHELYGIVAEYGDPDSILRAAERARDRGYTVMEAYTPYPITAVQEAIGTKWRIPPAVFLGGLLGFFTAWGMEYYIAVLDYPINVGGRPLNSWPSFIVIMFELTILFAAVTAFVSTLVLCGFPRPHHPMFNVPRFAQASNHRFFLCIEAKDPLFEPEQTAEFLAETDALEVMEVDED